MLEKIGNWLSVGLLALGVGMYAHRNYVITEADNTPVLIEDWQEALQIGTSTDASAKVQVIEFSDYECPFCKRFHEEVVSELKTRKDVGFTVVHFPLNGHKFANKAANMAECARVEGKFWETDSVIFANSDSLGSKLLEEFGEEAGIQDLDTWVNCVKVNGGQKQIDRGLALGTRFKILGTPTIVINGWRVSGEPRVVRQAIEDILQGKRP